MSKSKIRPIRTEADYETALACYRSPEYQRAKPLRLPHSVADFVIIEGYDGAQPQLPATPESARLQHQPAKTGVSALMSSTRYAAADRKGYWIAHIDVTEPEGYKAYMAADMAPIGKFGGRFLVRGGTREVVEGKVRARSVVLEFPSYQAALACYRSGDYQAAAALRKGKAEFDLIIIEGYDGPQY